MNSIWIVYNSQLKGESFIRQCESYTCSIEKAGFEAELVSSEECAVKDGNPLFALFMDKDIYAAKRLENRGIKVFNTSECIRICDDKALTYLQLEKFKIPFPDTIFAPKIYRGSISDEFCRNAAKILKYPLIMKECFGSFGQQVYLAENEQRMLEIKEKIGAAPFVFQKFIETSIGEDIRVIVSRNEVVGAVRRFNENDFRSNVENGGKTAEYSISPEQARLAVEAATSVGAAFAGVDLIKGDNGFLVCEVNSNFHFYGAQKFIKTNISDKIVNDLIFYGLNK